VLGDNNLPPAPTRARVRFVNSSTDIPSVDVFVNFSKQAASLAMNSASPGIEFDADATLGTSYEVDFNVSGSTATSLSLPAVVLLGGHSYSIYLVGSHTALSAVVTQDN
jgi:peptidoglycan/LPS O-acetylase OafA/YrhL